MAKKEKKEKKSKKYQNPVDAMPVPAYTRSEQASRRQRKKEIVDAQQRTRKKRLKLYGGTGFVFMLLVYWGLQAGQASREYALCKTFVELEQIYPPTLNVIEIDPFDQAMRIHFTIRNPHGSTMSSLVECIFRPDPVTGVALDSVEIDYEPYGTKDQLAKFNLSIPAIMAGDPDLSLPPRKKDTLEALRRDDLKY